MDSEKSTAQSQNRKDTEAKEQWNEVIDRRSREIEEGKVVCRPVEEVIQEIRAKLHARRQ